MNAGIIPQKVIDEVLLRSDIVEIVGKYVHLTKQGKYLKGLCPFHSEKTPSFTVTPEKQIFHCYGCGKGGNVITFIMEMEGESFPEAMQRLAADAGIAVNWTHAGSGSEPTPQQRLRQTLLEAHSYAAKLYRHVLRHTEAGKPAMDYLRSRGFTDKLIEEFGLGYAPARWDTLVQAFSRKNLNLAEMERGGLLSSKQEGDGYVDRFRDRIIFPIEDTGGRVIAFAGRLMSDGQPKYLNTPETPLFHKSRTLYRLHQARPAIRKSRQAVLFEGYVDCIKAWSAGVLNGVATMGTALTSEHAAMLSRFAEEVIICYDGDQAGQAAALKSIPILEAAGIRVRVSIIPGGMDPDEYIAEKGAAAFVRECVDGAVSAVKFQLIYLRKSHILSEEDGKIRYLHEAVRLIAGRNSPTERELLLKDLAIEFDVSLDTLKQEAAAFRMQDNLARSGDNPGGMWNNEWNDRRNFAKLPNLTPAYVTAERHLLSWMMQDAEVAAIVQEKLGVDFHVDNHAALAACLYAYYAEGYEPNVGRFVASLQDDRLEQLASAVALLEIPFGEQEFEDCLRAVSLVSLTREINRNREALQRAERAGNYLHAAQIGEEIKALEKKRREMQRV